MTPCGTHKDVVIRQGIAAGTEVDKNTAVSVVVSLGLKSAETAEKSKKKNTLIVAIVVLCLLLGGGWYVCNHLTGSSGSKTAGNTTTEGNEGDTVQVTVAVDEDDTVDLEGALEGLVGKNISQEFSSLQYFKDTDGKVEQALVGAQAGKKDGSYSAENGTALNVEKDAEESNAIPGYVSRIVEGGEITEEAALLGLESKPLIYSRVTIYTSSGKEIEEGNDIGLTAKALKGKSVDEVMEQAEELGFYIGICAYDSDEIEDAQKTTSGGKEKISIV